jgi:hypothetical protein
MSDEINQSTTDTAPAEPPAPEPKAAARTRAKKEEAPEAEPVPIIRQNRTTWWCPVDDHSMPQYMAGCANCGARRVGDAVIPA